MSNKIVNIDPAERMARKAEEQGWEEDNDKIELSWEDVSNISDGYDMILEGLRKISNATGIGFSITDF